MLSDGDEGRLMVGSSVDGREFVDTSGETSCDISGENAVLCSAVKTLEESEFSGISWGGLVDGAELLHNDVRVTDDLTLSVQLLRCGEVVGFCVHEVTSLHVLDRHGDGECLVGCDVL